MAMVRATRCVWIGPVETGRPSIKEYSEVHLGEQYEFFIYRNDAKRCFASTIRKAFERAWISASRRGLKPYQLNPGKVYIRADPQTLRIMPYHVKVVTIWTGCLL
jgi:hypothetical protein